MGTRLSVFERIYEGTVEPPIQNTHHHPPPPTIPIQPSTNAQYARRFRMYGIRAICTLYAVRKGQEELGFAAPLATSEILPDHFPANNKSLSQCYPFCW
jgi:hypothetical protein